MEQRFPKSHCYHRFMHFVEVADVGEKKVETEEEGGTNDDEEEEKKRNGSRRKASSFALKRRPKIV